MNYIDNLVVQGWYIYFFFVLNKVFFFLPLKNIYNTSYVCMYKQAKARRVLYNKLAGVAISNWLNAIIHNFYIHRAKCLYTRKLEVKIINECSRLLFYVQFFYLIKLKDKELT
jgi:hypothetical protein